MVSVRVRQRTHDVRRMEEASVAGESPDSSKQRESSEEPTSGSAGPVPEARTEASETRDPRLAVAREDAKPSASAGSAGSRGGVDTATRVLSVRETEAESDTEAESEVEAETEGESEGAGSENPVEDGPSETPEESGTSEMSDTSGTSEDDRAEPAATTDGRLRDAVAAWVATADERAAAEADAGDTPRPGAAEETRRDATADSDAPEDERDAQATDADTEAETGSDAAEDADEHPDGRSDDEPDAREATEERANAAATADSDASEDAEEHVGGRPVDQPTAVFKAPRPSAPAVDQPTTMLKLGDTANPPKTGKEDKEGKEGKEGREDKGGKGDKGGDAPARVSETDAERTSKFVALRHPDDPATRKPPPEAPRAPQAPRTGATTAVPQVGPERTTQQPLPPKPPLDLLAELTNTPPPPETPLRTTVRRVKIWTPLVILLVIVFGVVQSMRELPAPELDLTAQDSFTFEGGKPEIPWPSSGQAALDVQGIGTFGSSGDQKPVPIASVAKVMTAYVVLRDHPLKSGAEGPKIEIDQAAEDQSQAGQESTVNVFQGDSISQREALESILIASANNVARLLARWDAGSEKAFVEKMNAAAKDLGMTNTTYTDPSGLNNTTVSTAVDQVKLAKEAMKSPAFREVAAMMSYDDYKGVNHSNWNQLVGHNDVVGIKTGTTTSALGNLVFAAKKEVGGETRTIVGAVVRQPAGGKDNTILGAALDSSDKLIRAAQDTLESSTILKKGSVVGYVDDGLGGRTPVVATQDVKAVGWPGLTVKLTFKADEVPHTAAAGTKVGTLTVGDGEAAGAVKVPVALQKDLVEPAFTDKLTRLG
ncbi:D-alanyl-D-alanine carboxypeptidase [Streptomyces sp. BB1-1-1]|uniref:D-alanyl-D-alanine carboxypeptidase n=1 Tax=Streptomyces sp. BB1-1-1 TaxID=3074430 RepID=UPI002877F3F0|nr:D-alanyl-D-alanine carboxypeptidase [Streptomyces sp. BB1-1-1]WND37010.1 D-alanyl-D-alanine carboxypeptidase [Streptomyces sp. BB1-1-1]